MVYVVWGGLGYKIWWVVFHQRNKLEMNSKLESDYVAQCNNGVWNIKEINRNVIELIDEMEKYKLDVLSARDLDGGKCHVKHLRINPKHACMKKIKRLQQSAILCIQTLVSDAPS